MGERLHDQHKQVVNLLRFIRKWKVIWKNVGVQVNFDCMTGIILFTKKITIELNDLKFEAIIKFIIRN